MVKCWQVDELEFTDWPSCWQMAWTLRHENRDGCSHSSKTLISSLKFFCYFFRLDHCGEERLKPALRKCECFYIFLWSNPTYLHNYLGCASAKFTNYLTNYSKVGLSLFYTYRRFNYRQICENFLPHCDCFPYRESNHVDMFVLHWQKTPPGQSLMVSVSCLHQMPPSSQLTQTPSTKNWSCLTTTVQWCRLRRIRIILNIQRDLIGGLSCCAATPWQAATTGRWNGEGALT